MNRRTAPFKPGTPIFNIFSLTVGQFDELWTPPTRLDGYATALAVIEVVGKDKRIRRVRWRLDNCRRYTPRRLLARQAFLILCRILGVSPQRIRPRRKLTLHGFTRYRRRDFVEWLRRRGGFRITTRDIRLDMTAGQVVATVLAAPKLEK